MKKIIGIVGEGPTDYLVIKELIDYITREEHDYMSLQPEADMRGQFGNGWKGVWKWCEAASGILNQFFCEITPKLDLLVVQMDADVSRKEKEVHCFCESTGCGNTGKVHPLKCEKLIKGQCMVKLPCESHIQDSKGYEEHLEGLIRKWLKDNEERRDILITIPCDSTDAWIAAAYQGGQNIEMVKSPWENMIAKKKDYHGIRVPGGKKSVSVYRKFLPQLCRQWEFVTEQCNSAKSFDEKVKQFFGL